MAKCGGKRNMIVDAAASALGGSWANDAVSKMVNLTEGVSWVKRRKIALKDDETYEDNVKFIKSHCGPNVTITKDMPPIHENCGLCIGDDKLLREMDAAMQSGMMIAVKKVKEEQKKNGGYISWPRLREIFDSNGKVFHPMCEDDEKNSMRDDCMQINSDWFLKFDGTPDSSMCGKAESFLKKVVGDEVVWDSLKINKQTIKDVFSAEGVGVKDAFDWMARSESCAHVAIDVGVVRFPRMEDPYFKLYRLRVITFRVETAILMFNKKKCGIFAEFRQKKYKMTKAWTSQFDEKAKKAVAGTFNKFMDNLDTMFD